MSSFLFLEVSRECFTFLVICIEIPISKECGLDQILLSVAYELDRQWVHMNPKMGFQAEKG